MKNRYVIYPGAMAILTFAIGALVGSLMGPYAPTLATALVVVYLVTVIHANLKRDAT